MPVSVSGLKNNPAGPCGQSSRHGRRANRDHPDAVMMGLDQGRPAAGTRRAGRAWPLPCFANGGALPWLAPPGSPKMGQLRLSSPILSGWGSRLIRPDGSRKPTPTLTTLEAMGWSRHQVTPAL